MKHLSLLGLALLLSGCSVRGYSPEQVSQIRKIDRELCDLRIATTLLSLKTVAPMANDEGMELARPTNSGHDLTTCGMLEMGQDVHVSTGSLIVCDGLNNPKGVKLECGSIYACRESGGTLKVAGVVTYEMDCTFVREDIERHWNEYPACK